MTRPHTPIWSWLLALLLGFVLACSSGNQTPPPKSSVDQDNGSVNADTGDGDDDLDVEDDESSDDSDEDEDEGGGNLSAEDDCNLEEDLEDFGDFLEPEKLAECNDDGSVFDREAQVTNEEEKCHPATFPAEAYECTRAGIVEAFGNTDAAKSKVSEILGVPDKCGSKRMKIDQCGDLNGKPFIFFIGTERTEDGDLKVIYRQLKGS